MLEGWQKRNIDIAVAQCFNKALDTLPKTATDEQIKNRTRHLYGLLSDLKYEVMGDEEAKGGRKEELKQTLFEPNDHLQEALEDLPEGITDFGQ